MNQNIDESVKSELDQANNIKRAFHFFIGFLMTYNILIISTKFHEE